MKFYIKKLGCPKHDVDGDYISGKLIQQGHEKVVSEEQAEAVIVNTCGFILPAKEESIAAILGYENLKKSRRISRLYITGCLSQRYGDELQKELTSVDGIFGLGQLDKLAEAFANGANGDRVQVSPPSMSLRYVAGKERFTDEVFPYEYVKISDGCDRFCSFCAIPLIRGRHRSRPIQEIVEEARFLVESGKKEIILVSQEGNAYGRDSTDGTSVLTLLDKLEKIEGLAWTRLMYLHPEAVTDDLIARLSHSEKTLGYFDMPLQHISDSILKNMNRRVTRKQIETILSKIRSHSEKNIIRTTFIVGLPGESKTEYEELKNFIVDFEFDRLGVFKYSVEEGTRAARMEGQVSEELKEERVDELMILQQEIAFRKNIALIGGIQEVIIDSVNDNSPAVGRTRGDCPDIDQQVHVSGENLKVGDILKVKVNMADGYDLVGSVVR